MVTLQVGDRVEMKAGEPGWLGVPYPDLGQGTVVATKGEGLMEGLYVSVEWDEDHGSQAGFPAIQALRKVEEA